MLNLVIATDDLRSWEFFSAACEGAGATVRWAANGLEAIALVSDAPTDGLLLDLSIPTFSAWEVCDDIRNDPEVSPAMPIYILTDDEVNPHTLEQHGATATLSKVPAAGVLQDLLAALLLAQPR